MTRMQCKDDAARLERIASKARQMAEADMTEGLSDALYGDAPAEDLHRQLIEAKVALQAASAMLTDLKTVSTPLPMLTNLKTVHAPLPTHTRYTRLPTPPHPRAEAGAHTPPNP